MKILIKSHKLNYTIPYGKTILDDINLELHAGMFLGILGRNGVGKTTLIDLMLGYRPATSGRLEVLGEDPISLDRKRLSEICFISQDNILKGSISIRQFLNFYSAFYPHYSMKEEAELLKNFSLKADLQIGSLSTGQQKKIQIVAALSSHPKIVIIDEITAVLDPEARSHLFAILNRHRNERNMAIILATNIAEDLITRADQVLFLDNSKGQMRSPSEILNLFHIEKAA